MPNIEATIVEKVIPPLRAKISLAEFSGQSAMGTMSFANGEQVELSVDRKKTEYLIYIWPAPPEVEPDSGGVALLPEFLEDCLDHKITVNSSESGPIRLNHHARRGTLQDDGTYSFEPNYSVQILVADMTDEQGDKLFVELGGLARWERDALGRLRETDYESAQQYRQWIADGRQDDPPFAL